MSNTSDISADASVPSGETKPKVSYRKNTTRIPWLACIFVIIIGVLVTQSIITSSHKIVSYQPGGSPRFAQAGNYRTCQENKADTLVPNLISVDEQNVILVQRREIEAQLSDIHRLFSETVYPALEQLLESENTASDQYEDFFDAIHKAKTTLRIETEQKTTEIMKIARSLEETIQSPPDPKEWWWKRLATTTQKESFAKNQIEYITSLHRAHENATISTIRQIPQIGYAADKAHRDLKISADRVISYIQYERRIQTGNLNQVLLDITTKDAFIPRCQNYLWYSVKMRLGKYRLERKGRKDSKKAYETSLEILKKLQAMCRDLKI
ncbi:hypothetical protein OCU04_007598 [Sclerotinia nivalis]|uniref:Uncharacterized protein n=1 Tax=Sclerotinia nivalis TaxID=352851 RepID=A0A9X0DIK5_9HELO|nr:hypothetical protein OCU04_007598 [Sclerotinia nivalis]